MGESKARKDLYEIAAPFYDLLTAPFLIAARRCIVRTACAQECRRILDVACGTGELALMLAKAGLEVCGIDLSPAMLSVARRKGPRRIACVHGNGENLPFASGDFDCVTISLALHEMRHEVSRGVVAEILRVLAPGGKLIVFDYASLKSGASGPGLALMGLVEKMAGREHFRNFVRFTRHGGLRQLLEPFGLTMMSSEPFFSGALQCVTLIKE